MYVPLGETALYLCVAGVCACGRVWRDRAGFLCSVEEREGRAGSVGNGGECGRGLVLVKAERKIKEEEEAKEEEEEAKSEGHPYVDRETDRRRHRHEGLQCTGCRHGHSSRQTT